MSDNIVPFGKYKGQEIEQVAARDPQYLQWLTQQAWFVEKFQHLVVNINNFGAPPEETPAHNAMQVRFLEEIYRWAFVSTLKDLSAYKDKYRAQGLDVRLDWIESPYEGSLVFESEGWDVAFSIAIKTRIKTGTWEYRDRLRILVEIKPSVGDDFPAVLRQMKRQGATRLWGVSFVLLMGEYEGTNVTFDQVRQVFAASNITVVLASNVEAELIKIKQEQNP